MPRPYRPNPRLRVVFGRPPNSGQEGVFPTTERVYLPNPPDSRDGITLHRQVRGKWYWQRLDKDDHLSQAQAATFLHVSRMQVNRWVRAGNLKDKKILGTSRIIVAEILRFAKRNAINLRPHGRWLV